MFAKWIGFPKILEHPIVIAFTRKANFYRRNRSLRYIFSSVAIGLLIEISEGLRMPVFWGFANPSFDFSSNNLAMSTQVLECGGVVTHQAQGGWSKEEGSFPGRLISDWRWDRKHHQNWILQVAKTITLCWTSPKRFRFGHNLPFLNDWQATSPVGGCWCITRSIWPSTVPISEIIWLVLFPSGHI